jgi:hypothetical protein
MPTLRESTPAVETYAFVLQLHPPLSTEAVKPLSMVDLTGLLHEVYAVSVCPKPNIKTQNHP